MQLGIDLERGSASRRAWVRPPTRLPRPGTRPLPGEAGIGVRGCGLSPPWFRSLEVVADCRSGGGSESPALLPASVQQLEEFAPTGGCGGRIFCRPTDHPEVVAPTWLRALQVVDDEGTGLRSHALSLLPAFVQQPLELAPTCGLLGGIGCQPTYRTEVVGPAVRPH